MCEEYEVLFDWEPEVRDITCLSLRLRKPFVNKNVEFTSLQNPDDLRLFAGETLEVMQKNDHGWWFGVANRSGSVHKGYFPKNYVKPVDVAPAVPKPPPRPTKSLEPPAPEHQEVTNLAQSVEKASIQRGPSFSLKSCAAFDDLMELGYALELDPSSAGISGEPLSRGAPVEMRCRAEIWDGASTLTKEFANGTVNFVTGLSQVTAGLDAAVQKMCVGQKATITCAPAMAYGAAGNPPAVPPNSFVVFSVEILSTSAPSAAAPAQTGGAQILLGASGVASTRKVKGTDNRRGSRIILVGGDSSGSNSPASPIKPAKPSAAAKPGAQPVPAAGDSAPADTDASADKTHEV
jgi:hypothetical protein